MKHLLVSFLLWASLSLAASAGTIVIERPSFVFNTHSNVSIERIVLNESSTILDLVISARREDWIRISSDTYINADGKKFLLQSAEDIQLDTEVYPDESGKIFFSLIFPPIDPATKRIDFIESDCDNCFKTFGLALSQDVEMQRAAVPQKIKDAAIVKDDGKPLPVPQLKPGKAMLKGTLLGYIPAINTKAKAYVSNPITGIREEYETSVEENGTFELEIILPVPMQVWFVLPALRYGKNILLSPGKESTLYFDLPQKSCQETPSLKCPSAKYVYFDGANAEINNQMEDLNLSKLLEPIYNDRNYDRIAEMTPGQYKSYILDKAAALTAELKQKGLTRKALEFATGAVRYAAIYSLMLTLDNLREAYRQSRKLDYGDPELQKFTQQELDAGFYSFLKEAPINDLYFLYYSNCSNIIDFCKNLKTKEFRDNFNLAAKKVFQALIDSGTLLPEELEVAAYLKDVDDVHVLLSEETETDSKISKKQIFDFIQMRPEEINSMLEAQLLKKRLTILVGILGADEGIALDLLETQLTYAKMKEFTPLTAEDLQPFTQKKKRFYFDYLTEKNNELLAQIEANKLKGGYTVHDAPKTDGEQAFTEITKSFLGKVVFVDFWNTWCGPCLSAMKKFEPSKSAFKEKGVVFIYLADESSPISTWNNMIPDIPGEHFRLKYTQMDELKKKFGFRGIPSYLILNRQGEQIYFKTGFDGDTIKETLTEVL